MSIRRATGIEEVVDKNFHHASLVSSDVEWSSIQTITQFAPYIFIGNFQNAIDQQELACNNIKFVLAITPTNKDDVTLGQLKSWRVAHEWLALDNLPDAPISDIWDKGFNTISKCVVGKNNILIHCMQGVSSAPAMVAYYTLRSYYLRANTSSKNMLPPILTKLKSSRPCVSINFGFLEQLEDCEARLCGRSVRVDESLSTRRNRRLMQILTSELQANVASELAKLKSGTYDEES